MTNFEAASVDAAATDAEVREAVAEFSASTTDVTRVDSRGEFPEENRPRVRRPEDAQAERISLRRTSGSGRGEAQFSGPEAWHLADMMLTAWAPKRGTVSINFEIRFGDGEMYRGRISLPAGRRRYSLAAHCKRPEAFRADFCPDLTEKQAAALYRVFMRTYQIGRRADA